MPACFSEHSSKCRMDLPRLVRSPDDSFIFMPLPVASLTSGFVWRGVRHFPCNEQASSSKLFLSSRDGSTPTPTCRPGKVVRESGCGSSEQQSGKRRPSNFGGLCDFWHRYLGFWSLSHCARNHRSLSGNRLSDLGRLAARPSHRATKRGTCRLVRRPKRHERSSRDSLESVQRTTAGHGERGRTCSLDLRYRAVVAVSPTRTWRRSDRQLATGT